MSSPTRPPDMEALVSSTITVKALVEEFQRCIRGLGASNDVVQGALTMLAENAWVPPQGVRVQSKPQQVAAAIRRDVACGVYSVGSRLPGARDLATRYGVSIATVTHAKRILCDEGGGVEAGSTPGVLYVRPPGNPGDSDQALTRQERLTRTVRSRINDGTYPVGMYLSQVRLAQDLDARRVMIHDVLQALEQQGLVELRGQSAYVLSQDPAHATGDTAKTPRGGHDQRP